MTIRVRQGSYRGLASITNHFARESYIDGLAHLANMDPLEFQLKNLADPRLRVVFQVAAARFGWGASKIHAGAQTVAIQTATGLRPVQSAARRDLAAADGNRAREHRTPGIRRQRNPD
ncbi:MAG TPA: hypothetical protein VGG56_03435 [Terracidiphilus sp.]